MSYVFISDIHSNLSSLEKVLKKIEEFNAEKIYCLGDIIGYGSESNQVIDLLEEKKVIAISGNHEKLFLNVDTTKEYCEKYLNGSISDKSIEYLKKLKNDIILDQYDAILSHAVPFTDDGYLYPNSDFSILDGMAYRYIFMGHTHYPMFMSYYGKKIINPGSVGQPRDSNEKSSLLVCDLDEEKFEFIRV